MFGGEETMGTTDEGYSFIIFIQQMSIALSLNSFRPDAVPWDIAVNKQSRVTWHL